MRRRRRERDLELERRGEERRRPDNIHSIKLLSWSDQSQHIARPALALRLFATVEGYVTDAVAICICGRPPSFTEKFRPENTFYDTATE